MFFHLPLASSHLHSLQVENCDSNSRLVVNEDDDGKFRLERVLMLGRRLRRCPKINLYAAELFVFVLHPFEAGIAKRNFQLQMMKNIPICENIRLLS